MCTVVHPLLYFLIRHYFLYSLGGTLYTMTTSCLHTKDTRLSAQYIALKISLKKWSGHYSEKLSIANLPTLAKRRTMAKLIILYKLVNNLIDFPSGYFSTCKTIIQSQKLPYESKVTSQSQNRLYELFFFSINHPNMEHATSFYFRSR